MDQAAPASTATVCLFQNFRVSPVGSPSMMPRPTLWLLSAVGQAGEASEED